LQNTDIEVILPTNEEAVRAGELRGVLERRASLGELPRVQVGGAASLELPPIVARLLIEILEQTAAGHAVTLVPVEAELTIEQAAEELNVSPSFVAGMIKKRLRPSAGDSRRMPLRDVLAYKAGIRAKRRETPREMAALDQDLGIL
jgi:hypothetical protein